jgi:hypothetical protein
MPPKLIHRNLLIGFRNQKRQNLDMQAMHDKDVHPSPCNKTLSMDEILEINNLAVLIRPEQADFTIRKNMIIGKPKESKKGKKI